MKNLITIFFLTFTHFAFGQTKFKKYIEVSFSLPWKTAKISLTKGTTEIYTTTTDSSTILIYKDLEAGYYKLAATSSENISEYRDSILVALGQKISANIGLENTCLFAYPKNYIPTCPAGHKNEVLEIRYRNEKNRSKEKKYYSVVYTATGCIPRYYCTRHGFKF
jgi:hypothetical protein